MLLKREPEDTAATDNGRHRDKKPPRENPIENTIGSASGSGSDSEFIESDDLI